MKQDSGYILHMKNCRKEFPGVVALDNVSLHVKRGQVHAIVGENGAGKSTIMKILAGILLPDKGEIFLSDKPYKVKNPTEAMGKGISMIHQELDLMLDMTVEQNIFA
jgi:inositol transport system ATP-binding protein